MHRDSSMTYHTRSGRKHHFAPHHVHAMASYMLHHPHGKEMLEEATEQIHGAGFFDKIKSALRKVASVVGPIVKDAAISSLKQHGPGVLAAAKTALTGALSGSGANAWTEFQHNTKGTYKGPGHSTKARDDFLELTDEEHQTLREEAHSDYGERYASGRKVRPLKGSGAGDFLAAASGSGADDFLAAASGGRANGWTEFEHDNRKKHLDSTDLAEDWEEQNPSTKKYYSSEAKTHRKEGAKRAPSAWQMFVSENMADVRADLRKADPGLGGRELSKEAFSVLSDRYRAAGLYKGKGAFYP